MANFDVCRSYWEKTGRGRAFLAPPIVLNKVNKLNNSVLEDKGVL